jgi:DNA-directed RNA polymerase subunit beta
MLTINDEEVELRDLDDEDELQPTDALNILPASEKEDAVETVE